MNDKKWHAVGLLILFLVIRWIAISISSDRFEADPDVYGKLAIGLATHGFYGEHEHPTAFRPPLYPWLLSWFVDKESLQLNRVALQAIHSSIGASTCLGVWWLFIRYCGRRNDISNIAVHGLAATAGFLTLVDPVLVRQSQLIMTETLATFLAIVVLIAVEQLANDKRLGATKITSASNQVLRTRQYLLSGLIGMAFGLSTLCRPTALIWLGLFVVWQILLCVRSSSRGSFMAMRSSGLVICIVSATLVFAPWVIRNRIMLGRSILTTTHGGYTLYLANNQVLYDHLRTSWGRNWDDQAFHQSWIEQSQSLSELEQDRVAFERAMKCIRENPNIFVKSCFVRVGWFWALWPNQGSWYARVAIGIWYAIVFLAAAYSLLKWLTSKHLEHLTHPLFPALLLVVSLVVVHSVYWSNMRMRAVALPIVYVLATMAPIFWRKGPSQ